MKTFAEMDQEWKEQHSRDLRAQAAASYEGGRLSRDKEVEALRAKLAAFKRIDLDEEIDARYGFMIEKKDAALRQAATYREQRIAYQVLAALGWLATVAALVWR